MRWGLSGYVWIGTHQLLLELAQDIKYFFDSADIGMPAEPQKQ